MSEILSYELRDGVAILKMDDGKANALSHAMLDALHAALDRAGAEAKAIVLTGREGRFCAGFDLRTMMTSAEAAANLVAAGAKLYMKLYGFPLPVVAACSGHAMAGGALLLLSSDTRLGAEGDFKIGLNEVRIALPLPMLAQELARDRLSKRHLTPAALQATIYSPEGAVEVGYLDRLVAPEGLMDEALVTASQLALLPQHAYADTKRCLRAGTIHTILDTLDSDLKRLTTAQPSS